jgi:hypothetical protein
MGTNRPADISDFSQWSGILFGSQAENGTKHFCRCTTEAVATSAFTKPSGFSDKVLRAGSKG